MEKVNERNEKKSFLRPRCKIAVNNFEKNYNVCKKGTFFPLKKKNHWIFKKINNILKKKITTLFLGCPPLTLRWPQWP